MTAEQEKATTQPAAQAAAPAAATAPVAEKPAEKSAEKPAAKAAAPAAEKPAAKKPAARSRSRPAAKKAAKPAAKPAAGKAAKAAKAAKKPGGKKGAAQKFRVRLSSFDYRLLDASAEDIVNTARRVGAIVCGPIPLPARRRRYDILRSPHKYKKSREQIEIREYFRLLDIVDVSNKATSALASLELPAGVHPDIKVLQS